MTEKRAVEPKDMFRLRLLSDAQISPDGSRVAFVLREMDEEKNDYVSNIYLVDSDGHCRQFTAGDKDSAPRWSPDGKWLAFLSGRKERQQIHLLPTAGGESIALTDRKLGAGTPEWSPDSNTIAFVGPVPLNGDEEEAEEPKEGKKEPAKTKVVERTGYKFDGAGYIGHRRTHIFTVEVASKQLNQLTHGDFRHQGVAWSPDGKHLAFASNREPKWDISRHNNIFLMPAEGGQARQVTPDGGSYMHPFFSADGQRIGFLGNPNPDELFGPQRLFSINRDGSEMRQEAADFDGSLGFDVIGDVVSAGSESNFYWQPDGIYFLGTERGVSNIYRTAGNGEATYQPVTNGRHAISGFTMAGSNTIAYAQADITHPAEIYLLADGKTTQLTHENDALLEELDIREPERFSYTGANGEESEGWLLPPRGYESGKHPLILYIHGGPSSAYGESLFFEYQFLAGQGFGVYYPNIHGSSTYGREYQNSIRGNWGDWDFQDIIAGLEEAASRPWVDQDRLGVAGGSYGGYMTSWVIGHDNRFKAALAERMVSNFVSFMGTSDGGWHWNTIIGAYPEENLEHVWKSSPIAYVANVQTPTLVMHSERDDRCPIEQGEQYFNALRRRGVETKLIMFPEESHGLSRGGKPSRRVERLNHINDWFRQHL